MKTVDKEKREPSIDPNKLALPKGIQTPVTVYTARERLEAETLCDLLRDNDIVVLNRPAAFGQIQAYSGADARFGIELVVDKSQAEAARLLIDEAKQVFAQPLADENELSDLAENAPPLEIEDTFSIRTLSLIIGALAVALVLLYLVTH